MAAKLKKIKCRWKYNQPTALFYQRKVLSLVKQIPDTCFTCWVEDLVDWSHQVKTAPVAV